MTGRKRLNIGLAVGNVEDIFSNSICKGAMQAAEEEDANLFIFPVKYLDRGESALADPKQKYEYQYNVLLSYVRSKSLDCLLLCLGSIGYRSSHERCMKVLEEISEIPIILIASEEEGYSSIKYDNQTGLSEGIRYLIHVKMCKNIGMLSCVGDNVDIRERLEVYRTTLEENGLEYSEDRIAYGELSTQCIADVEALLDRNPDMNAIVCGNDAMAFGAYKAIKKRGLRVGEDIYVIGFDDIEEALQQDPPLATVRADAERLGYEALKEASHRLLMQKEFVPIQLVVPTAFVLRESAGAPAEGTVQLREDATEVEQKLLDIISMNHRMNIVNRDMLMFGDSNDKNYARFLEAFAMEAIDSAYLFLLKEPVTHLRNQTWELPDTLYLKAYRHGSKTKELPRDKQRMSIDEIFSNPYMQSERKTYLIIDVYSREQQYGILICDMPYRYFHYAEMLCYQVSIAIKMMEMFSLQENLLREKEEMLRKLSQENLLLDDISTKDELTGILNRRGFFRAAKRALHDKKNLDRRVAALYIDLNYLKQINDRYGHEEGDYAISQCARVLEQTMESCGFAGRIGGDEFAVLRYMAPEEAAAEIKASVREGLIKVNETSGKPYEIMASVGVYTFTVTEGMELKSVLEQADDLLYEAKKQKEPFRTRE